MHIYTIYGGKEIADCLSIRRRQEQILEHMKISVKHRLAGLRNVASDNISLCSSWGLFDSIFAP